VTQPTVMKSAGADGVVLESDCWGDPSDPPLVLVHGGGQTRNAWAGAAAQLSARGLYVVTPDLRGHGRSGWAPDGDYFLRAHANDLHALAARLSRPPIVVGASLGGLTGLVACGEAPQLPCAAMVMVDIAHRAQPAGITRIVEFMRAHPDGFADLEEAAAAVAAYLPHRAQRPDTRGLENNLRRRDDGRWRWHWDPKLLDAVANPKRASSPPSRFVAAANQLPAALCLVRGATSDVIDEEIVHEFLEAVPGATTALVAGAGHMVAGDRNDRFVEAIVPVVTQAAAVGTQLQRCRTDRVAQSQGPASTAPMERVAVRVALWGGTDAAQRAAYAEHGNPAPTSVAGGELATLLAARDLDRYVHAAADATSERSALVSRLRAFAAEAPTQAAATIDAVLRGAQD